MKKISKIIIICMFLANYVNASQTINIGFQNFNFNSTAHTLSFDVSVGKGSSTTITAKEWQLQQRFFNLFHLQKKFSETTFTKLLSKPIL